MKCNILKAKAERPETDPGMNRAFAKKGLLSAAVAGAVFVAAAAGGKGPVWQEDLTKAIEQARQSKRLVLVIFGDADKDRVFSEQLEADPGFNDVAPEYILVRSGASREEGAKILGLVTATPTLMTGAIVAGDGKALEVYDKRPDIRKITADMKARLGEAILRNAGDAAAAGDDTLAVALLRRATITRVSEDAAEGAKRLLVEVCERGKRKVLEVDALVAKRSYLEARRTLEKIARDYAGTDAERAATEKRSKLLEDPVIAEAIRQEERAEAANGLLKQGAELEAEGKGAEAMAAYDRTAREYAGTDAARQAAEAMARMRRMGTDNPTVAKMNKDCRLWMSYADTSAAQGKQTQAISYYKKIIETYPDSAYASVAKEKLAKLE